ncbi:MAG: polyprenyl synthetase family protein [Dehalococcoidales bacterium]|nr:polyprenyl synthetase family protein [Dehalococcoidales bacterium]
MELDQIYAPVREDLNLVRETIRSLGKDADYEWLARQLVHITQGMGKAIRPALTLLTGRTFKYDMGYHLPAAVSVELMHTATLVHDDVIDKAPTRRGRATINSLWGDELAILMGDYLFAKAGEFVAETRHPRVIKLFSQTLATISRGEIIQFRFAYNPDQTRDDYFRRIYGKTGSLFSLSTQAGAILGQASEEGISIMRDYGDNLGIAFQIVDDILDFTSTPEALGKPAGSDLVQGTLTLPAMLLLERYPDNNPVRLFFETRDKEYATQAIQMVLNSGVIDECYRVAREFRDRACRGLSTLPGLPSRKSLLDLAEFVVNQKA